MKVAITGKGGVGKTTITALLARAWAQGDSKVLAIDADPMPGLAWTLGFPEPEKIIPLSEMTELVEERTGAKAGSFGQIFKLNPRVEDLPEKIAREHDGIKLIVMGGIKTGGSGCACPESALIKALVSHIILERNELVIMDMEAGIEHLGRSTAGAVDLMIIVVEPSLKSIQTAHKIRQLANQIGIKNIKVIANKIRTEEDRKFITTHLEGIKLLGSLPFANDIIESGKKGVLELTDQKIISEIDRIKSLIS